MKITSSMLGKSMLAACLPLVPVLALAADPAKPAGTLFADEVLCKGKGVEIRRSHVDEVFTQFSANAAVRGQTIPDERRPQLESQMLDRLVITRLMVNRATDEDRKRARAAANRFIEETKKTAGSDESFERQLRAMSFSPAQFDAQILERAICEEVVDRELKSRVNITEDQARKYYAENGERFDRPEMVRASHILLRTRDGVTGLDLSEEAKKEKREKMGKILERARKGEDFAALAREYTEDLGSRENGGEYTFGRGQTYGPDFERAAFSLPTNQVSEVVASPFGYHIIKVSEKIPGGRMEFGKVEKDLKEFLAREEVQSRLLPEFITKIKKEANVEYLNGARPPEPPALPAAPVSKDK
jgi:peptidyl-prolyl cis-trans isomerase C